MQYFRCSFADPQAEWQASTKNVCSEICALVAVSNTIY